VLVLHGLGGGPYELQPVIDGLTARGVDFRAIVLPGHEGGRRVMPCSHAAEWTAAVEGAYEGLAEGGRPVAVVGFSTGGTLALELASRRPVLRLVLLAPFLAIRYTTALPFPSLGVVNWLSKVMPDLPRRDPPVRDTAMRPWVKQRECYRTFNLEATASALELIERVKPELGKVTAPTLVLQGRRDSVVEPKAAEWLLGRIGSTEKRLVWVEGSDHLVALDREREWVSRMTVDFLVDGRWPE
jgi:carboxylesterase